MSSQLIGQSAKAFLKQTPWKEIAGICILLIMFVGSSFLVTRTLSFPLSSDYDTRIPLFTFLQFSLQEGHLPLWNPYVATGIPVFGDPLNYYFNPFMVVPLLFFSVETSIKISFLFAVVLAALSWWFVARHLGLSQITRVWTTLLYASNGALYAAFAAGHIEKWFVFAIFPVFFVLLARVRWQLKHIAVLILSFTALFWSDSIYMFVYAWYFFVVSRMFVFLISNNRIRVVWEIFFVVAGSVCLISPKLIAYAIHIVPILVRDFKEPLRGSIHLPFTLVPFVSPWGVNLYDRPFFQRTLGFYYNWYEYFSFISPIPFLFLRKIRKVTRSSFFILLLILSIAGLFFLSAQYIYSPVHWLYAAIPFIQQFRVPQRITVPLTTLLLLICGYVFDSYWKTASNKRFILVLLFISIVWTAGRSGGILIETFTQKNLSKEAIIKQLRRTDSSDYYVLNLACCNQVYLMNERIPNINFYNGWKVRTAYEFYPDIIKKQEFAILQQQRPRYILEEGAHYPFEQFGYMRFIQLDGMTVWKTEQETIRPSMLK